MSAGPAKTAAPREPLLPGLRRRRAMARAVLLFERVWPVLWPPAGVIGAFFCAALLDLPAALPPMVHLLLLVATGLAAAGLLVRGWDRSRRRARPRRTGGWSRTRACATGR